MHGPRYIAAYDRTIAVITRYAAGARRDALRDARPLNVKDCCPITGQGNGPITSPATNRATDLLVAANRIDPRWHHRRQARNACNATSPDAMSRVIKMMRKRMRKTAIISKLETPCTQDS